MRTISRFNEFLKMEDEYDFHTGNIVQLSLIDSGESIQLDTEMIESIYSMGREVICYKFKVIKSNSEKYPKDSEIIFPIKFNKKKFGFIINIPYKFPTGGGGMAERHYSAYVEMV